MGWANIFLNHDSTKKFFKFYFISSDNVDEERKYWEPDFDGAVGSARRRVQVLVVVGEHVADDPVHLVRLRSVTHPIHETFTVKTVEFMKRVCLVF